MKYYYCFDIGGTAIKGAIIDEDYNIIVKDTVKSNLYFELKDFTKVLLLLAAKLEESSNISFKNCDGIGMAVSGLMDSKNTYCKYIYPLRLLDYDPVKELAPYTSAPIKLGNDAEVAGLAEYKFGCGKGSKNFIIMTIGTGIGCCIIVNGERLRNNGIYNSEAGHMMIGDTYYEELASTRALINRFKKEMTNNKDFILNKKYTPETIGGHVIFDYIGKDKRVDELYAEYIKDLGNGIVSIYNIFTPEVIALGGGVSNQKEKLIDPLIKYVNEHIFVKDIGIKANIKIATLTNDAGVIGCRILFDEN